MSLFGWCLLLLAIPCSSVSATEGPLYRAAVSQLASRGNFSASVQENLKEFSATIRNSAAEAAAAGAQILVLPESVFWGRVVDWSKNNDEDCLEARAAALPYASGEELVVGAVLCDDDSDKNENKKNGSESVARAASCAARESNIVLSVNTLHAVPCASSSDGGGASEFEFKFAGDDDVFRCRDERLFLYNTEVAFSEDGAVLAVYHKSHIWGTSPILDQPVVADPVTFDTSFGVTFGVLVC